MPRTLIVGAATGREHIFAARLARQAGYQIDAALWDDHPVVRQLCQSFAVIDQRDVSELLRFVDRTGPDYVVVGHAASLVNGLADGLAERGIACIGPLAAQARIEGDKAFLRHQLDHLDADLSPRHLVLDHYDPRAIEMFLVTLDNAGVVVKKSSLAAHPRVTMLRDLAPLELRRRVDELVRKWLTESSRVVLEELIRGREVALLTFTDGISVLHSPPFVNYKQLYAGGRGPNTSGLGCVASSQGILAEESATLAEMQWINAAMVGQLNRMADQPYRGCLYGEFLVDERSGRPRVLEFNCRFGNPSMINMVHLAQFELAHLFEALVEGSLHGGEWTWSREVALSACVVPEGYMGPDSAVGQEIDYSEIEATYRYIGKLDTKNRRHLLRESRALTVVAMGATRRAAVQSLYGRLRRIDGPVYFREDIGTWFGDNTEGRSQDVSSSGPDASRVYVSTSG